MVFSVFSVFFRFFFFGFFGFFRLFRNSLFRCFCCFASIPKQRVSIDPKQTEDPPKQFKREYIWVFFRNLGLFRFVTKQFCLFPLFRYRFEKRKQTETFCYWFHETNAKQILFRFVSVRTENYFCLFRGHPTPKQLEMTLTVDSSCQDSWASPVKKKLGHWRKN